MRDDSGKNIFAVSKDQLSGGRSDAAFEDTKFFSQEGEWFLAGVLDGIADGELIETMFPLTVTEKSASYANGNIVLHHIFP